MARLEDKIAEIWRALSVRDGQAHCEKDKDATVRETFDEKQLIVVRRMGEAIYPALTPINAVKNGDPSQPHHLLIEADNYHALQLMLFHYEGKVDCIYIDPPYNTGSRDWKYNNDYVDGSNAALDLVFGVVAG
jgi:adenine-specific DNA-methyltransferase